MKPNYRPEIDGLRAIAVVFVILYHAQISLFNSQPFQGGFIGVDIFFVISGYLITSIILNEMLITGTFSFKYFYERRIRRIIPVLLFVMLVSLPFAWIYLIPNSFIDYSKSILYSLGFTSNFYFYFSGQAYGASSSLLKPFLHTWSLSVEEQYYILFPIILLIIFKFFKQYLIYFLIFGFIVSLLVADWGSRNYPGFNFYILPTRGWELLAGSILSYFEIKNGYRNRNKVLNSILPKFGIILILPSIFFFNDEMLHPSLYTLLPVIGVCLIIWFSNKDEIITKIFSTKLFVSIGLISYSLYLWHYPIFAFARVTSIFDENYINQIFSIILIFILSIISFYFIEQPFRNKKNNFKYILYLIVFIYFIIFTSLIFLLNNKTTVFDKNLLEYNELENTRTSWEKCIINEIIEDDYCKIGNFDKKVFLIGDSHLIPLINDLSKKLNKNKYELNNLTQPGFIYKRKLKEDKRSEYLKKIKNSIFIFGGYYQRESKKELNMLSKSYIEDFDMFLKNNNKIIFLTPMPLINFNPEKDLYLINQNKKKEISISKKEVINKNKDVINFINQFNNIYLINLNKIFCDNLKCYAVKSKENILKSDYDHPSLKASSMINDLILNEIKKLQIYSD